ncbi:MAG: ribonuclease Z [Nanoarchaeota archaeon]|nr:ribonuclease Z [Nanoarchaeota archaeon]
MKINITFLGTASAIPTKTRNHTSILLNYKDENILIDCGEASQRQIRIAKINPCSITRILITHFHGDHVFGLPGLFQTLGLNNYQKKLYIYGPKGIKEFIDNIFKYFITTKKIEYEAIEAHDKFFENKDFELHSIPLDHGCRCQGYIFKEKDKLRINKDKFKKLKIPNTPEITKILKGKSIKINNKIIKPKDLLYKEKGKKISFIFDTRMTESIKKLAKDSDLSIIDSTFLSGSDKGEEKAFEYYHMTSEQAGKIAKQNKVKELILTHFSQRYEHKEKSILDEAKKIFPNTRLAHDFMRIEV